MILSKGAAPSADQRNRLFKGLPYHHIRYYMKETLNRRQIGKLIFQQETANLFKKLKDHNYAIYFPLMAIVKDMLGMVIGRPIAEYATIIFWCESIMSFFKEIFIIQMIKTKTFIL